MTEDAVNYHAEPVSKVLESLGADPRTGLSRREVHARRREWGPNRLAEHKQASVLSLVFDQFKSVVILILALAAGLSFVFQHWAEGIAIVAVLLVNTAIGFISEWRARTSMAALRAMGRDTIRVRRGGKEKEIASDELVPGDVMLLEDGDVIPADGRLVEANSLRLNESALTGEAVPANKTTDAAAAEAPLAERPGMVHKGTIVTTGSGQAVVVATGSRTELGRIAMLAESGEEEETPLQERLNQLGRRLAWITLCLAAVVAVTGLSAGKPPQIMLETAIALGVAAIPEGLPIVATIALARGMWLMARRRALINRLPAVETLGTTTTICTDKTGTLTENRMTLARILTGTTAWQTEHENGKQDAGKSSRKPDESVERVLRIGVLCNNANVQDEDNDGTPEAMLGDPTEVALLRGGLEQGIGREELLEKLPEEREVSFDPRRMMMATFHRLDDAYYVAVKGAPEAVLESCEGEFGQEEWSTSARDEWMQRADDLAADGFRVLGLAEKQVENVDAEPYQALQFVGLVALEDPPRQGVRDAIAACQKAGIRVVMVTGDRAATARAIAEQVGLAVTDDSVIPGADLKAPEELSEEERQRILRAPVFARVSPEQKLHLIHILQEAGESVAMTGDGVNDSPALKNADIGVAMGMRGTDAAREAADMILKDDSFATIVAAVRQGRVIFGNIRKSVLFMLCTNVAEIIAVAAASVLNIPLPLRPLQILYLNVLTDVLPALALGVGDEPPGIMERPPRRESVLTRKHWLMVVGWGVIIALCVLAALGAAVQKLSLPQTSAVTVSFLTLALAKLWFVLNLRDRRSRFLVNEITGNPWIWAATAVCVLLLVGAVYLPGLSTLLQTRGPGSTGWALAIVLGIVPAALGQIFLKLQKHRLSE